MTQEKKKTSLLFVHPCLGIGGAEQLIVSAGLSFKNQLNYNVDFITTEFDPKRCFPELLTDFNVTVCGTFVPKDISGSCVVLCYSIKVFYLFLYTLFLYIFHGIRYDIIFVDSFSGSNFLFKIISDKVIFYCHFPIKEQGPSSSNFLFGLYKKVFAYVEEKTMFGSDIVCFNSKFTQNTAKSLFSSMKTKETYILYPPVNFPKIINAVTIVSNWSAMVSMFPEELKNLNSKQYVLSLNRYGKLKKIERAIFGFNKFHKETNNTTVTTLVIAGGYDPFYEENKSVFRFLETTANEIMKQSSIQIIFLKNIPDSLRWCLLYHALTLIYTPSLEHFGIVPVESMAMGVPPIVCESGGVLESVIHNKTGYWCKDTDERTVVTEFATFLKKIISRSEEEIKQQQHACQNHVKENFTFGKNFFFLSKKKKSSNVCDYAVQKSLLTSLKE